MRKGQSTLEYAVVIACIVGALLSMQVYITRAVSGRLRSAADEIGQQYDPGNTTSAAGITTSISSDVTTTVETVAVGDLQETTTTTTYNSGGNNWEKVYGTENVGALGSSLF